VVFFHPEDGETREHTEHGSQRTKSATPESRDDSVHRHNEHEEQKHKPRLVIIGLMWREHVLAEKVERAIAELLRSTRSSENCAIKASNA